MSLSVGETVGPYRIVEQLGQGGMGTVYRAYHAALDRDVAIKVLHPALTTDSSFLARFQREARVVARLEHPNIVPVYDYAQYQGAPYLVMKFIAGLALNARLARSALTTLEVLRCVEAVGAALQFAHGQGVLHRDVKPSNIMLAADGAIYLTDFGLARMAQAGESTLSADSLLGTPSYMSPEQARGDKELDAGTDIYSFGVVVYELLVGRVPFSGSTPYAVIHDHIFTPLPAPRSLNSDVSASVETILQKALAKERADRYATVGEMVSDLRRALQPMLINGPASAALNLAFAAAPTVAARQDAAIPPASAVIPIAPAAAAALAPVAIGTELATEVAKPAAQPPPAARSPYRLQGWQIVVVAVLLLGGCALVTLAVLAQGRRLATTVTQTAVVAVPTTAVVAVPSNASPSATPTLAPTATAATTAGPAQAHLLAAERAFVAGQLDTGLAQLDQAVAVNPSDTMVLLHAADLALAQRLAVDALRRYYVPGYKLESAAPDARAASFQSHAALAFYVAAADPTANSFLAASLSTYPDAAVPLIAQQRYAIFFASGQGALAQLNSLAKDTAPGAFARLVLGDYYLARGQLAEATRHYTLVAQVRLANGVVPDWIIRESRCDLDAIRTQRTTAKLETTCVDLSLLLTGR